MFQVIGKGLFVSLLLVQSAWAIPAKQVIQQMAGCFEVTYEFVEDGTHDKKYAPIYEWIRIKQDPNDLVLEHIGQYPLRDSNGDIKRDSSGNPLYMTQYHWSERWQDLGSGIFKQTVRGPFVNNNYRYDCQGRWKMNQFHCHADKAVTPRRDRKRGYDYMNRVNNLQVNSKRWVHAQRNEKINTDGSLYSVEMGWNVYKRVDDKVCAPAINDNPQRIP